MLVQQVLNEGETEEFLFSKEKLNNYCLSLFAMGQDIHVYLLYFAADLLSRSSVGMA